MGMTKRKGHVWAPDRRNLGEFIVREALTSLSHDIRKKAEVYPDKDEENGAREKMFKFAASLQSRGALTKALPELQAHPALTLTHEDFDKDLYLLGTPGGTVDLRTGHIRNPDPADLISKATAVAPKPGRPERWLAFLEEATAGDKELEEYLQKLVGYSLTGSTQEQSLHFIHGPPLTGKSVFVATVSGLFGTYHENAPIDTFASAGDRHPTDLAKLAGARLVTAVETQEGRPWDTQRIKSITGGDRISARFMRQDFFDYVPTYKILVVGNHEPEIKGADEAMMRRLHVIPFESNPAEVDRLLVDRLKEEWPEILQWAIDGCLKWLDEGLTRPAVVAERTERYRQEEDPVGTFIEECCVIDPEAEVSRQDLYRAWLQWCHQRGEQPGTLKMLKRRFAVKETAIGFTDVRLSGHGRPVGYKGLGLNAGGMDEFSAS
jgi:putative DNA primase/helicase